MIRIVKKKQTCLILIHVLELVFAVAYSECTECKPVLFVALVRMPALKRVVSGSRHDHLRRSRERHFATLLHATFMSRSERSTGRIVKPSHRPLALAMPFATVFAESVDLLPHRASGNIAVHSLPDLPAQVFRIKAIWMANLQPFWLPRIWGLSAHLRDSKSHAKRRWWTWGL